ncbi:non-ribosomal peptide synthetase [Ktedonobacteria bacterium brp13]|nr:non-ribosomal peptide synthetase [Ktedonobacteria bacterium brp13]
MHLSISNVSKLSPKQRALFEKLMKKDNLDISRLPIVQQPRDTDTFPLSFSQQRMWFLQQAEPESAAYNCPTALHLAGKLSITALQQTWKELVRRHEVFRTTFTIVNGYPCQVIDADMDIPLQYLDMSAQPELLQLVITKEVRQPFDLVQGPLLRIKLLYLGQDDYVFVVTMHHIISDGWSIKILVRELTELYTAYVVGRAVALSAPLSSIQYADYAVWQREWFQSDRLASQLTYWKERLADVPAFLSLPTDRPRPSVQSYRGAFQPFILPDELSEALRGLSRTEGATVFMALLAAFNVLLFRYTHQEDILVGTPIANRNRAETENVLGCFINTLVLRNTLSDELSFRQLLARVRETTLSAYANQDLPFEQLVEALRIKRDPSHTPLIQVLFVFQNIKIDTLELPDLLVCPFEIEKGTAQFDLTLEILEEAGVLHGHIVYNTDLFNKATIERMLGHYRTLLEGIVAQPEQRIADLSLLTQEEAHALLTTLSETSIDYTTEPFLPALIEAQVARTPDVIAFVVQDVLAGWEESLTYAQLNQQADVLASVLQNTYNIRPGEVIGLCLERSLDMVIGLLGILKCGGAYLPLDPMYPAERLAFMLQDSQASVVLTQADLLPQLPADQFQSICLPLPALPILKGPRPVLCPDQVAYVIYTSGSTGRPKGTMITHRNMRNFALSMQQRPGLTSQDVVLAVTSLSFDMAVLELLVPLTVGARIHLASRSTASDAVALISALERYQPTLLQTTPARWQMLLAAGWVGSPQLKILCGGEALSLDLAQKLRMRGASVWNMYGPTETTVFSSLCPIDERTEHVSIGRPIENTQLYVLDARLQPVPVGFTGELYIGGDGLAAGYLGRPDLTAERFIPHPFGAAGTRLYATGDVARYLADGCVDYLGRNDQQVKVRGFRIELGEIESILGQHREVRECLVLAREDLPGEKRLVAYLIPVAADRQPSTSELRSYLATRLPEYMLPAVFVVLSCWPVTPNGKVDRSALPAPEQERPVLHTPFVAPRMPTEEALAEIWQEVLGLQQVGIHDNFFELGGHSLLAIQLVLQIRERLEQHLSLSIVFQKPTIEAMARLLSQQAGMTCYSPLVAIQPDGSRPPFFCVHPAPGNVFCYADLARYLGPDQPFYGLQAQGIDGQLAPLTTIGEMATAYIQEIRTVQPAGPYMLGGHSLGGLVIFEMALQLHEQGEEVALLAILDRPAPVLRKSADQPSSDEDEQEETARLLTEGMAIMSHFSGKEIVVSYETLRHMETDEQFEYIRHNMQISGLLPDKADIRPVRGLIQVQKANSRATNAYIPAAYKGNGYVAVLAAEQTLSPDYNEELYSDESLGWGELIPQGVQIYRVPGNHISMLMTPQVQVVAKHLRHCLDQAQEKMMLTHRS